MKKLGKRRMKEGICRMKMKGGIWTDGKDEIRNKKGCEVRRNRKGRENKS